jgi:hypothetical protein
VKRYLATCLAVLGASAARADPPLPSELLQRAFDARYECAIAGVIAIETRKGDAASQRRRMEVASKSIGGRLHTYAVFREPPHVRGMAFLGVEAEVSGRSEERFVYLPSLRKIRRVSGSQEEDAFLGTDLSYHDFERQREASYEVSLAGETREGDEPAWIVVARPRESASYERVEHTIAMRDAAILATRYFKRGIPAATKLLRMARTGIVERGACRVPTRIVVEDAQRGTSTRMEVASLTLDADLPDDLFSMTALETKRAIPFGP